MEEARLNKNMVEGQIKPINGMSKKLLNIFHSLDRNDFIPEAMRNMSYIEKNIILKNNRAILKPDLIAKIALSINLQSNENVLILGTGGASKAVSHVLKQLNLKVNYITRKSSVDSKDFFGWNELNENMVKYHKFIINTTPIGMFPNHDQEFSFPYQAITNKHFVMDLIYNPEETNFLKKAKKMGANTINGYSMLVFQALKSWDIWNS